MRTMLCMSLLVVCFCGTTIAEETYEHLVNVSLTGGIYDFEGDEAVDDTQTISLHLGLDLTERWTLEAVLTAMPRLEENFAHSYGAQISRLESEAGAGVDETSAIGIAADALYHFTRWERLDPYLSVGVGAIYYEHDFDDQTEPTLRVGGGVLYHLSDRFAVRADLRVIVAGTDTEINSQANGGIMWTFAKRSH